MDLPHATVNTMSAMELRRMAPSWKMRRYEKRMDNFVKQRAAKYTGILFQMVWYNDPFSRKSKGLQVSHSCTYMLHP